MRLYIFSITILFIFSCNQVTSVIVPMEKLTEFYPERSKIISERDKRKRQERIIKLLNSPDINPITKKYLANKNDSMLLVFEIPILDTNEFGIHYSQYKILGDINGDKRNDTLAIIPELQYYTDYETKKQECCFWGASYIFSDTTIPRIRRDCECVNLDWVFTIEDIDEDGKVELGHFVNSCSSRYKTLEVLSLKNGQWISQGDCVFDLYYSVFDETTNFRNFIRKTGKGKFEMFEQTDLVEDDTNIGEKRWLKFEIK